MEISVSFVCQHLKSGTFIDQVTLYKLIASLSISNVPWMAILLKMSLDARVIAASYKWTSRIRTSSVPGGHPRHDSRGPGKRRYQEGTREQYRG